MRPTILADYPAGNRGTWLQASTESIPAYLANDVTPRTTRTRSTPRLPGRVRCACGTGRHPASQDRVTALTQIPLAARRTDGGYAGGEEGDDNRLCWPRRPFAGE